MKVVEIFKSIDGEGARAGLPVTFIRLAGCNLRCRYCDTRYSYEDVKYKEMSVPEIVDAATVLGLKSITLTGGEPLIHKGVRDLIAALNRRQFKVNVETNGSVDISPYLTDFPNVFFTVDWKCPSSGAEVAMLVDGIRQLREKDVLKFVVGTKEDLDRCRDIYKWTQAQVFISPVFGEIEPKDIVEYVLEHGMYSCRVQVQLHKIIWDPEMKGV